MKRNATYLLQKQREQSSLRERLSQLDHETIEVMSRNIGVLILLAQSLDNYSLKYTTFLFGFASRLITHFRSCDVPTVSWPWAQLFWWDFFSGGRWVIIWEGGGGGGSYYKKEFCVSRMFGIYADGFRINVCINVYQDKTYSKTM